MYENCLPNIQTSLLDEFELWASYEPFVARRSLEDVFAITYKVTPGLKEKPKVFGIHYKTAGNGFIMPESLSQGNQNPEASGPAVYGFRPTPGPFLPSANQVFHLWIPDESYESFCKSLKDFPRHTDFRLINTDPSFTTNIASGVARFEKRSLILQASRYSGSEQAIISCSFLDEMELKIVEEATSKAKFTYFENTRLELTGIRASWMEISRCPKEKEFVVRVNFDFDTILNMTAANYTSNQEACVV